MHVHLTEVTQFCNVSVTYGSSYLGTKECLHEEAKLLLQESDCLANIPNSKKSQSDFEVLGEKSIASSSSNSVIIQHPKSELNNANTQCLSSYKKGTQQYKQHHDSPICFLKCLLCIQTLHLCLYSLFVANLEPFQPPKKVLNIIEVKNYIIMYEFWYRA